MLFISVLAVVLTVGAVYLKVRERRQVTGVHLVMIDTSSGPPVVLSAHSSRGLADLRAMMYAKEYGYIYNPMGSDWSNLEGDRLFIASMEVE